MYHIKPSIRTTTYVYVMYICMLRVTLRTSTYVLFISLRLFVTFHCVYVPVRRITHVMYIARLLHMYITCVQAICMYVCMCVCTRIPLPYPIPNSVDFTVNRTRAPKTRTNCNC